MKTLFVTLNGIEDREFGGAKASIRNFKALKVIGEVDVYAIRKKSNLKSILSLLQGFFPPIIRDDVRNIKDKLSRTDYDIVFFDSSVCGKLIKAVKKQTQNTIVFFHNCEVDYNKVRFNNKRTLKSIVYQIAVKRNERMAAQLSDYRIVFTQRDYDRISKLYNVTVEDIIPIGLEDKYVSAKEDSTTDYCLLFGPLGSANEEGFSWFVKNVSPYIRCKTVIAGKGFEKYREVWESEKVTVIGFVKDISEVYSKASCVSIPLFSGGGMKIKTAEAMMFGKQIFGTTEAFVGYDVDYTAIGALCNTADEFIQGINDYLVEDTGRFNSYARECYVKNYSIEASRQGFDKLKKFASGNGT